MSQRSADCNSPYRESRGGGLHKAQGHGTSARGQPAHDVFQFESLAPEVGRRDVGARAKAGQDA